MKQLASKLAFLLFFVLEHNKCFAARGLGRKVQDFSAQSGARIDSAVWSCFVSSQSPGVLTFRPYLSSSNFFPPVSTFPLPHCLSAPGSPRMAFG